jgi:hypothetical protein
MIPQIVGDLGSCEVNRVCQIPSFGATGFGGYRNAHNMLANEIRYYLSLARSYSRNGLSLVRLVLRAYPSLYQVFWTVKGLRDLLFEK